MKIVGYLMQYNESSYGNLHRCLENLSTCCDEIVVYDDASTDDSLLVINQYTDYVIEGRVNDFTKETAHRQQLLELALSLSPDYIFWLDADETLDRAGTDGGLRRLCEEGSQRGASYEFEEVTLWRSSAWRRVDYLGKGKFLRLWCAANSLRIPVQEGLHCQLYPEGLAIKALAPFKVLHYGYATKEAIERRWRQRTALGVPVDFRKQGINESRLVLEPVPQEWFPKPNPAKYSLDIMREAGLG